MHVYAVNKLNQSVLTIQLRDQMILFVGYNVNYVDGLQIQIFILPVFRWIKDSWHSGINRNLYYVWCTTRCVLMCLAWLLLDSVLFMHIVDPPSTSVEAELLLCSENPSKVDPAISCIPLESHHCLSQLYVYIVYSSLYAPRPGSVTLSYAVLRWIV